MALLFKPHIATVYEYTSGAWTATGDTIEGHLGNRDTEVQMTDSGFDMIETGTWMMDWEDRQNVVMGNRLLVAGDYWIIKSPPQAIDTVVMLSHARVRVEKVVENG